MKGIKLTKSYTFFKNIYANLDIRALLMDVDNSWELLFCTITASVENQKTIKKEQNLKNKLGIKIPHGIKLIKETKNFPEFQSIIKNMNKGKMNFNSDVAKISNSDLRKNKDCELNQSNSDPINKLGFTEMIGNILFNSTSITPLIQLKNGGFEPKNFGLRSLDELKDIFDVPGLDYSIVLKFVFPIPFKMLNFNESGKTVFCKSLIHPYLAKHSVIRLQASEFNKILRRWENKPLAEKTLPSGLIITKNTFDISSYTHAKSFDMSVENRSLESIYRNALNYPPREELLDSFIDGQPLISMNSENLDNDFLKYLKIIGFVNDPPSDIYKLHNSNHTIAFPNNRKDLIVSNTKDPFYKDLGLEINISWRLGLFSSTLVLSRKYIENLVIDVLRNKYPVSNNTLNIYFNDSQSRFHDFSYLLENLKQKKSDFKPDVKSIEKLLILVNPFKTVADATVHSIIENPEEDDVIKLKIPQIISILEKLL